MPDTIICIRGKRIKELNNKKNNCKNWVENTRENAEKEFKIDPDIPAFPYCRECLDKVKMKLLIQLNEVDKNCKKKGGEE